MNKFEQQSYKDEYIDTLKQNIVHLTMKRDFLQSRIDQDKLTDTSEENVAKVKLDVDAFDAKITEIQEQYDFFTT